MPGMQTVFPLPRRITTHRSRTPPTLLAVGLILGLPEQTAKSIFKKMRASGRPTQSACVQEPWDMMKKEISAHESHYTWEKCAGVGKK
jgi:hypothetical protein